MTPVMGCYVGRVSETAIEPIRRTTRIMLLVTEVTALLPIAFLFKEGRHGSAISLLSAGMVACPRPLSSRSGERPGSCCWSPRSPRCCRSPSSSRKDGTGRRSRCCQRAWSRVRDRYRADQANDPDHAAGHRGHRAAADRLPLQGRTARVGDLVAVSGHGRVSETAIEPIRRTTRIMLLVTEVT